MIWLQELMVTLGRTVSREGEGEGGGWGQGDREDEGQKIALWMCKNHKGCFLNKPVPIPT